MKRIRDNSPSVDEHSAVFPGDTVYSRHPHFSPGSECPVNVNSITLSPHTGAHADAPLHYARSGQAIGAVDLLPYLGVCRVIHCMDGGPLVRAKNIAHALIDLPPRVLLRTSRVAAQSWDASALTGETVALLASMGAVLVGIDTPSVDPATSQDLPSHQQLLRHNLRVPENLLLDGVGEGDYELIALPLKLSRADASPVRATLRER